MTLILELPDNQEAALKARALSQGVSVEQLVQRIVDRILEQPETVAAPPAKRRISQRIAEIMADVPAEEFAKLPRDGARQVDHYIYGLPKRD
jgi:plasmid stability protein